MPSTDLKLLAVATIGVYAVRNANNVTNTVVVEVVLLQSHSHRRRNHYNHRIRHRHHI